MAATGRVYSDTLVYSDWGEGDIHPNYHISCEINNNKNWFMLLFLSQFLLLSTQTTDLIWRQIFWRFIVSDILRFVSSWQLCRSLEMLKFRRPAFLAASCLVSYNLYLSANLCPCLHARNVRFVLILRSWFLCFSSRSHHNHTALHHVSFAMSFLSSVNSCSSF